MNALHLALVIAIAGFAFSLWAEDASATTVCHATGHWCQGYAHASTATGGVASARCFALRVTNTAPTCTTSGITPIDETTWQIDAGSCITLRYFDTTTGVTPPAAPNKVSISAKFDNTGTNVIVWQSLAAEPANGAAFSLCGTNDGLVTGSARAGTFRINVRAVKDNGNGLPGNTNYDINSDCETNTASCTPSGGPAIVGAMISGDRGAIRSRMFVSSITHGGYPSGSTYAYGPGGDETATITASFTTPLGDSNIETMHNALVDEATISMGAAGAAVDVDTGSLAQGFTIDLTFPVANNPHIAATEILGNSALTGLKWTTLAATGHGSCIVRDTDLVAHCSDDITIDARIAFDSDGSGTYATADEDAIVKLGSSSGPIVTVFNRGETVYSEFYIFNARGEQLTRTMTIGREDATPTTCASASLAPTAGKYGFSGGITTGTCVAVNTEAGSPRYYRATNTDQSHRSGEVHTVSTLLFIDAHLQADATLNPDDYPTEDANEEHDFFVRLTGGVDDSDTVRLWCGVQGVRKDVDTDTTGTAVTTWRLRDPTGTTRASTTGDTDSTGFTPTSLDLLATTPLGAWNADCTATFNSNTGTDTEPFTIGVEGGGGGETVYTGADPLTLFCGNIANGTVPCAVHSRFLNGEARVGAAASIFVSVFTWPDMAPVITGASVVEVDPTNAPGAYAYNFTPPYTGSYLVSANTTDVDSNPIGAHNVIDLTLSEHRDGSIELLMTNDFAGLGFDGFIFLLFWIAVLLFASYMGWLVLAAFSIPGILFTAIPTLGAMVPDLDFPTLLAFSLLGFVLEVAANRWSWGGYESGKRKLRLGA